MKIILWTVGVLVLLTALAAVWVRLAPVNAARWHQLPPVSGPGDSQTASSYVAVRNGLSAEDFARLIEVGSRTPRTRIIAGSLQDRLVTFETRSRLWGFPDYTTIGISPDGLLTAFARLRFGSGDHGVNAARVRDWFARAGIE